LLKQEIACQATFGSVIVLVVAIGTFLVAAKAHGRQLRLERERAGYATVSFRSPNPPFVEQLWRAERRRFWPMVVLLAAASIPLHRPSVTDSIVVHAALPFIGAFVATGITSVVRTKARDAGTIGWWVAATLLVAAVVVLRQR
jgi:hypothetical protein